MFLCQRRKHSGGQHKVSTTCVYSYIGGIVLESQCLVCSDWSPEFPSSKCLYKGNQPSLSQMAAHLLP